MREWMSEYEASGLRYATGGGVSLKVGRRRRRSTNRSLKLSKCELFLNAFRSIFSKLREDDADGCVRCRDGIGDPT
uniref:Uncharacterized protein n=1 Tax=Mycena chlorophos TaxID=658473 RepID=A0ABQ0L789_MYCCL|nr:predicted protein [Mycena chlorophos]